MAWQALANFAVQNPQISIPLATSTASALYRAINPDRQAQIRDQVLNSQINFRDALARRAFGDFTPKDTEQIMESAEPQVNQISAGLARRGVRGGAASQVIAQAQQRPFEQAQQQALHALPIYDQAILGSAQMLMNDGSFTEDLQAIASLIAEELDNDPSIEQDEELFNYVYRLWTMLGKPKGTMFKGQQQFSWLQQNYQPGRL